MWWKLVGVEIASSARESEVKTQASSLVAAENAYFSEYHEYSDDFRKMGYSSDGRQNAILYLKAEDVPGELKEYLSEEYLPFVHKEEFQILAVLKNSTKDTISFWVQRRGRELKRVKEIPVK